ncbi:MAG TPA: endo alpha-1,4 polygalactosaminidase [Kofleriaceae bacterium]|jgi:hypothetical protein
MTTTATRLLVLALAACGSPSGDAPDARGPDAHASDAHDSDASPADSSAAVATPPPNAMADYQLGGDYDPPSGVTVVSRDRTDSPAAGLFNICYINGFQIQPGEESTWTGLILEDNGAPVVDPDWDEDLIDVSTPAKRAAVAAIIGGWIDGCRANNFDAIEIDNLDSYSRSHDLLTADDNVAAMSLFSARAHAAGLAIAQKNSAELVPRRADLGTDFAVAEECDHYDECDSYTAGYADDVIVIEYERADFTTGCSAYPQLSIILRDRDLVTPSDSAYVYDGC